MRIGIVNDVRMAVEVLRRTVERSSKHTVVWVAYDGATAVERCIADMPDLVLMDLIMPKVDGVEATRRIMVHEPCPILLVTSSIDTNQSMVFEAIGFGALDAVNTPVLGSSTAAALMLEKIREIGLKIPGSPGRKAVDAGQEQLVCLGASSGGPAALTEVFKHLPGDYPGSIIVIQQLSTDFARGLADWLDEQTELRVRSATTGDVPTPGTVFVAAAEEHLVLTSDGRLAYTPEPFSNYRPSVDVFLRSVADRWQGNAVGILLTGMGEDGAEGLLAMREAGFHTIAQDQASCTVYGMSKAAMELGAAAEVLALDQIGPTLLALSGAAVA